MEKTTFTQGEAAKATGFAKSKISADMASGKLSCHREKAGGRVAIDASELIRVYGDRFRPERLSNGSQNGSGNTQENDEEPLRAASEPSALEAELKFLREKIVMVETMRASEVALLSARIEEFRASLTDARDQRDRMQGLLSEQIATVKQLTDQRARDAPIVTPPPTNPQSPAADAPKRRGLFGLLRRAG